MKFFSVKTTSGEVVYINPAAISMIRSLDDEINKTLEESSKVLRENPEAAKSAMQGLQFLAPELAEAMKKPLPKTVTEIIVSDAKILVAVPVEEILKKLKEI